MIKQIVFVDSTKNRPNVEGVAIDFRAGDIAVGAMPLTDDGCAIILLENIGKALENSSQPPHQGNYIGFPVVMSFNEIESINVLIKSLEQLKAILSASS